MAGVTLQDGKTSGPGEFSGIWAMNVQDAKLVEFVIDKVPPGEKPQLYADQGIAFQKGLIKNVRAAPVPNDHVEGLHVAGTQGLKLHDIEWKANDVMHLFLTVWVDGDDVGTQADPTNGIEILRNRFGGLGVNESGKDALGRQNFWYIDYHTNLTDCPNSKMIDCQVRGSVDKAQVRTDLTNFSIHLPKGFSTVTYGGQPGILVVPFGAPWPAFPGDNSPPIPPQPVDPPPEPPIDVEPDDLAAEVQRLNALLTTTITDLNNAQIRIAALEAPILTAATVKKINDLIAKYEGRSGNVAAVDREFLALFQKLDK
jgi:hypothetical protein